MDKNELNFIRETIYEAVTKATDSDRRTTSNFWSENKVWMTEISGELKGIKEHLAQLNGKTTKNKDYIENLNVWRGEIDLHELSNKTISFTSWLKGGLGAIGFLLVMGIGYKTKLIVPNAHANAQTEQRQIAELKIFAQERGLDNNDIIFTSQEDEKYKLGVPQKIVSDFFRVSNIFIFP